MGFTTIFGALVIKSLRVYRVFMRTAMKRVKVTLFRILKILSIFCIGDTVIFVAWYAADFQESPWIFGSVVVVLVGCFVIMPMTYPVTIRASTYYVFLALALIVCTVLIMCLMLVPKLFRLKEVASSSVSGTSTANSMKSRNSMVSGKPSGTKVTNLTNISESEANLHHDALRNSSQKYQVKTTNNNTSTNADEVTNTGNY
ncbi:unnamed protein product [Phytophthora fragariaefolia]|uniref:Unnamed protein product n=1 Tax=Phytophthora fragariaefolia TaxID=1490495 RepID=A0A9W6XQ49_9STRA|nr:unnamed protein product [Phytophthora fragariaefolia]